ARVVHEDVERAERVERVLDDGGCALAVGDVVVIGLGLPAGSADLLDDEIRRATTVLVGPDVVGDDRCALLPHQQGLALPDPAARAAHDRHSACKALPVVTHARGHYAPSCAAATSP